MFGKGLFPFWPLISLWPVEFYAWQSCDNLRQILSGCVQRCCRVNTCVQRCCRVNTALNRDSFQFRPPSAGCYALFGPKFSLWHSCKCRHLFIENQTVSTLLCRDIGQPKCQHSIERGPHQLTKSKPVNTFLLPSYIRVIWIPKSGFMEILKIHSCSQSISQRWQ